MARGLMRRLRRLERRSAPRRWCVVEVGDGWQGDVLVVDDFTSASEAVIQLVRWQGAYCDPRFQVPLQAPPAVVFEDVT